MKKILIGLVAVAMLAGVAMADVDVSKMTDLEKYGHAKSIWGKDRQAGSALFNEIKDSEELTNNQRARSYQLADLQSVDYAKQAVALADEKSGIRGHRLAFLFRNTDGAEQEGYLNELVRLAGQWSYPYEVAAIPFLLARDREAEAKDVALKVLASPRANRGIITRAFSALEVKEGLNALISTLPDRRNASNFVPSIGEDGKLVDEFSVVTEAMSLIEANYDKLTYAERTDFRRRIDGVLGMTDPVHRILKEAIRSAQEADRKSQELFE